MALVFLGDVEAPVRCALELSKALQQWPDMRLRMGAHVLFMDIVAYSQLPMDEQHRVLKELQAIVRNSSVIPESSSVWESIPARCIASPTSTPTGTWPGGN